MRIFVTGGSGLIGSAIVNNLICHDHHVFALARSKTSRKMLTDLGATAIMGDITDPAAWINNLPSVDAIIHTACTFDGDMAKTDRILLDHLIPAARQMPDQVRFIYTGGTWLFPQTNPHDVINESAPFAPLPDFEWMCAGIHRVLGDDGIDGIIIHPACVYATGRHGHYGMLARNIETARAENRVTVIGSPEVSLPIIHTDDLADLYRRALCHAQPRSSWFGVAINGVTNQRLAQLIAKHFGDNDCQIETISTQTAMDRLGSWAAGLAHHQAMENQAAIRDLGWSPVHQDIAADIKSMTRPVS
ncbi:NAD-dependent epimerase/dehydratase family protein [Thalassospira profundimaris]|uniref:NAD-dependent epimerase/dehydratase family protein n=1 Tax=Thalassospira profundimaris TaxID=502049 RepID=UPI00028735CF|nr:NAD-dependent epimerase/dehydratase family protein [Thalassospira profundimaris]EKF07355.1 NAD-dependent epimerase/dehydratase [Thalassospira profundimaris WP0211]